MRLSLLVILTTLCIAKTSANGWYAVYRGAVDSWTAKDGGEANEVQEEIAETVRAGSLRRGDYEMVFEP